jgi:hypothetical protein
MSTKESTHRRTGRDAARQRNSKSHTPNHFSRINFRQLISVDVEAAFLDLRQVRLDQTTVQMLQERQYAHFKHVIRMSRLRRLYGL